MIIRRGYINNFYGAVFTLSLLGMMYSTSLSWSSPVELKFRSNTTDNPFDRPLHKHHISWIASLLTLGACVGCWAFALLIDICGRRPGMIALGVPMIGSYLAMIFLIEIHVYYVARFVMGITVGGIMTVTSAYQSEMPAKDNRGKVFAWFGVMISFGTLFAYSVGPFVSVTLFNIILLVLPTISVVSAFVFCEESPYYCVTNNNIDKAKKCLSAFRKADANIDEEIKEIEEKIKEQYEGNIMDVFKTKAFIKSFFMGIALLIFQQLTGIFAILMYSEKIFHLAGTHLDPYICSIILGSLFLLSGCVAPFLIERVNRRTLLIASAVGMVIFEAILGTYCILDDAGYDLKMFKLVPVLSLGLFIFSYNFGNGPVTWVVSAEIFPTRAKAFCLSCSVFIFFVIGFLMTTYFHTVVDLVGLGVVCLIFAGCCLGSIFFVLIFLIETRGKTLGEIQDELKK